MHETPTLAELFARMRVSTATAVLGGVAVVIGSLGPWLSTPFGSISGVHGKDDGWITLGCGVIAMLFAAGRVGRRWASIVAFAALAVALGVAGFDGARVVKATSKITLFGVHVAGAGWGIYAVAIGGAVGCLALAMDAVVVRERDQRGKVLAYVDLRLPTALLAVIVGAGAVVAGVLVERSKLHQAATIARSSIAPPTPQPSASTTTSSTQAAATSLPAIPTFLGPASGKDPQIRPGSITYTGDGTGFYAGYGSASHQPHVGQLNWTTYTTSQAQATGGDWTDNCTSACANGLRTAYRVSLKADTPESLDGYQVFTRLRVAYLNGSPPGTTAQQVTLYLSYDPSYGFQWASFMPGDQNPNDADASTCDSTMEIGPHSDCALAQQVASDLAQGVWSAPGTDTVTEGGSTITFTCMQLGTDYSQTAQPGIYSCSSQSDPDDWFEFEFT